jgi:hypothetical protein
MANAFGAVTKTVVVPAGAMPAPRPAGTGFSNRRTCRFPID